MDTMDTGTEKYSIIVGVFRDRASADQAAEALKQAGIGGDTIELTEYIPDEAEEEHDASLVASGTSEKGDASPVASVTSEKGDVTSLVAPETSAHRILVHVKAEGREQEAVAILTSFGSNNSDLPPGTELVEGSIVSTSGVHVPKSSTPGSVQKTGRPVEFSIMETPTTPSS